ncbi:MAG: metallophosphatase family protein [Clostridiales bacterium 38-18]|nr:MAG: metallophosphatase family protein [Clostridiales bacterium 38-18]
MERFAIISDIHGNLTALNAVLKDIEEKHISKIICLGDIAGKGPRSAEAIDIIKERCAVVVKGNWDYFLTHVTDSETIWWHRRQIGAEREAYLKQLPEYYEISLSGYLLRLCHASPNDIFYRVHLTTSNEKRIKLFEETPTLPCLSDIVGYGDIHGAYIDNIGDKVLFNVGSVGNPLDFNVASYAIVEGNIEADWLPNRDKSAYGITICRVPYDVELEIKIAEEMNMPELIDYSNELRTAIYRGRK